MKVYDSLQNERMTAEFELPEKDELVTSGETSLNTNRPVVKNIIHVSFLILLHCVCTQDVC